MMSKLIKLFSCMFAVLFIILSLLLAILYVIHECQYAKYDLKSYAIIDFNDKKKHFERFAQTASALYEEANVQYSADQIVLETEDSASMISEKIIVDQKVIETVHVELPEKDFDAFIQLCHAFSQPHYSGSCSVVAKNGSVRFVSTGAPYCVLFSTEDRYDYDWGSAHFWFVDRISRNWYQAVSVMEEPWKMPYSFVFYIRILCFVSFVVLISTTIVLAVRKKKSRSARGG